MGARSGFALKFLQWFNRGVQFLCAAVVLGIYCYFLATLANHDFHTSNTIRAVTGISGAAVLYTIVALLLLCCLAGKTFTALLAIILDIAFIGAFIYVAVANRNGASSCQGYLDTPFGKGQGDKVAEGTNGFTVLPSFHTACRLQTASLAVAIIAIIFFIFSILTEVALARHHRKEKRFGPGPANNYTSGYSKKGGLLSRLFSRKATRDDTENALPAHTTPHQLDERQSYATETTAIGQPSGEYNKYENGFGHVGRQPAPAAAPAAAPGAYEAPAAPGAYETPAAPGVYEAPALDYRYGDGTYDRGQM